MTRALSWSVLFLGVPVVLLFWRCVGWYDFVVYCWWWIRIGMFVGLVFVQFLVANCFLFVVLWCMIGV